MPTDQHQETDALNTLWEKVEKAKAKLGNARAVQMNANIDVDRCQIALCKALTAYHDESAKVYPHPPKEAP